MWLEKDGFATGGVCEMDFRFERMGGIVVAGVMIDYVGCF